MSHSSNPFGSPIFSYSRSQAINDGVLIDLTQFKVIRDHWKIHLACTDTAWNIVEAAVKEHGKDIEGILHDLSVMAKLHIKVAQGTDTLWFQCIVGERTHQFKLHCGPGDSPVPVLTLMLSNED